MGFDLQVLDHEVLVAVLPRALGQPFQRHGDGLVNHQLARLLPFGRTGPLAPPLFLCDGSGCGAFKVLGRIVGRGGSPFSLLISSRNARISACCSSMTRSKRSTSGVRSSAGTSMPATLIGSAPSMPNRKHQNHPPSKDQFHGVIENLPCSQTVISPHFDEGRGNLYPCPSNASPVSVKRHEPDPAHPESSLAPAATYLAERGVPIHRYLRRRSCSVLHPESGNAHIVSSMCDFLGMVACAEGIHDLGYRIAGNLGIESLGVYGRLIAKSHTLHDSIEISIELIPSYNSGQQVWMERHGDQVRYCQRRVENLPQDRIREPCLNTYREAS